MEFVSPSKDALLQGILPDMKLTMNFFKQVYGYELSYPGFADQAIEALEGAGCSRARSHYQAWVSDYLDKRDAELKPVAAWYRSETEKKWKDRR